MLRALAGMGTAAKKNLSQLAVRFRGGQGAEGGSGSAGGSKEFKQLVESGDKEVRRTSQPKCYEVVLYTDDVQLLHRIYFYMT